MTTPRQLPLTLSLPASRTAEDFLVADCNREAVRWLQRWPDWPHPALVLHGPAGCGKTHLAHMLLARSGGASVELGRLVRGLDEADETARAPLLVVDDADRAVAVAEEPLLHLYNAAGERRARLLLTAATPPSRWPIRLADLRSRLLAAASVGIGAPDDELLASLLVKLFADRQLRVEEGVILYLLPRIERSFAAARRVVEALDRAALAAAAEGRRRLTLPLLRQVLQSEEAQR